MRRWLYPSLIFAFAALGLAVLAGAYYMPEIREAVVFQPVRRNVETNVRRIADGQKAAYRKTGKLVTLSPSNTAPGSAALDLNWTAFAEDGFQYDAVVQPNRQLRVRALPKPEAVSNLEVPPQMYVADISPQGDFVRGGWYP